MADLVKTHVPTLKKVIDVQDSGNTEQAFVALRQAIDHMEMAANPLDGAIVNQFPAKCAR